MPVAISYPGVYIEEIPSGVRTIIGVSTSITAFVGRALTGPTDEPVRVQSFAEYGRIFGGLWVESTMSYAVQHYFMNGGTDAIIVRAYHPPDSGSPVAKIELTCSLATYKGETLNGGTLTLIAANQGTWGNDLYAKIDHKTLDSYSKGADPDPRIFNLTVSWIDPKTKNPRATEQFLNVSTDINAPRSIEKVLMQESNLVRVEGTVPAARPDKTIEQAGSEFGDKASVPGSDGVELAQEDFIGGISTPNFEDEKKGIYALRKTDLFNILCLPPMTRSKDMSVDVYAQALALCMERRAMLIIDPPKGWTSPSIVKSAMEDPSSQNWFSLTRDRNAAVYFPRLKISDPLKENRLEEFAPCGAVAGIFARTDAQRGVWKAPAGTDAKLIGVRSLSYAMTDKENGLLNPLGANCLRAFPVVGHIVWGARTLEGADQMASEWKYIPIRRLALYIEESLFRGTQWVVFEPNDEPLWAQIRLNVGAFMHNLFRQGAFQGKTPQDAYIVKCDSETTTQTDRNSGIVNILVGFAPLKPAEFVIIKIQQMAGQIQT